MPQKQADNAWVILTMLFLANVLNLFDRTIPGLLNEPVRAAYGLNDFQLGLISTAFTVVYGVFGLPLGRLADTHSRKAMMAVGLGLWSIFTGLSGLAPNFLTYVLTRMAVGIGEASFGPASMSMIGDAFPANKRGRAIGLYWLGLPVGVVLSSLTVGAVVKYLGDWHLAFFVAMFPGLILAGFMLLIREPSRGGAEAGTVTHLPIDRPLRRLFAIRTFWWIIIAGLTINFSSQTAVAFLTPLLQRYYGLSLGTAAGWSGFVFGVSGLIGFMGGGWVADWIYQRSDRGRLLFGATSMVVAAAIILAALLVSGSAAPFLAFFTIGWILQYQFYTSAYAALQDVVQPRMRAIALAAFYVVIYLTGGTIGPTLVGALSDRFAQAAMTAAGAKTMTDTFRGAGLHDAMFLIPCVLFLSGCALFAASTTFRRDVAAMVAIIKTPESRSESLLHTAAPGGLGRAAAVRAEEP